MPKKNFRSFEDAREFVQSLSLKSGKEWREYYKSNKKPDDIPKAPDQKYKNKGWKGWGDFLGTGNIANYNKVYKSFEEAREFAQSLSVKSQTEWIKWCKSGEKPEDIPSNPQRSYKNKGWKGFGDFFGTGRIADQNKVYKSFEETREFVQSLNLKNIKEWHKYCKSGKKPDDIPKAPDQKYKNKGWKGWGDFLGTGRMSPKDRVYKSFEESREFAQSLKLKCQKEWSEYSKSRGKPDDIPGNPNKVYKDKGWKGIGDFLGTGNIANKDRVYRSFEEARKFAQSLGLKSLREWREYCKSGKNPEDISASPHKTYKDEYKGIGDFLGTGTIRTQDRVYKSFKEAKKFVQSLNLKSRTEWYKYCNSGKKPNDIPANPSKVYRIKK